MRLQWHGRGLEFLAQRWDSFTVDLDASKFNPPLDTDHDGFYRFTTISVPKNVTVRFPADKAGWAPLYFLSSGNRVASGKLDLSGAQGHQASNTKAGTLSMSSAGGLPGGHQVAAAAGLFQGMGSFDGGSI